MMILMVACGRPVRPAVTPTAPSPVHSLIPLPVSIESTTGDEFVITKDTAIVIEPGDSQVQHIAAYLSHLLAPSLTSELKIVAATEPAPAGSIYLGTRPKSPLTGAEGYELTITSLGVRVEASQPAGLFYGIQTLRHLLPTRVEHEAARPAPLAVPAARIVDAPRFAWRGAMLDVSRHFFRVEEVKRYLDLLSLLKFNRLHLHLSDDQGWRIEIKSWPRLTTYGGSGEVGGTPGGFYTQQQYGEIVDYARERFITIVPEIDLPGHTNAALASYPELNCDGLAREPYTGIEVGFSALCIEKEITYTFVGDVIRELASITPGPYVHIGGDEVKTLTPQQYAQFIERVQGIVQSNGKQMIGWDETAAVNLLPTSIVQHWRPRTSPRAAVEKQAKVILSPADRIYLDMKYDRQTEIGLDWAAVVEVSDAYNWDPASLFDGVPEASILGVEAALWSETVANMDDVEFLAFPRLAAVAEIGWSAANRRHWDEFRVRLGAHARRWAALGVNFYRSPQVPWRH